MPSASLSPVLERPVVDLPVLTGLRFPVALWVVLYHSEKLVIDEWGSIPVIHHGYLGVDVFFLISGFILAHVYRQRFARSEPGLYRHFVWLRFARVWPAYAAVLLIAAIVGILRARWGSGTMQIEPLPYFWEFLRHLAMLQSWGLADFEAFNQPGWSLRPSGRPILRSRCFSSPPIWRARMPPASWRSGSLSRCSGWSIARPASPT